MYDPQMPATEHAQFETLCQGVDEYETLPELHPRPARPMVTIDPESGADTDTIDEEILAGLISP